MCLHRPRLRMAHSAAMRAVEKRGDRLREHRHITIYHPSVAAAIICARARAHTPTDSGPAAIGIDELATAAAVELGAAAGYA